MRFSTIEMGEFESGFKLRTIPVNATSPVQIFLRSNYIFR